MSKMKCVEKIVLQVLEEQPRTRADDYLLMLYVTAKTNVDLLNTPFADVMLGRHINGLPNWETVTRCRRKIQEKRPDLIAPNTAKHRRLQEKEYREYAHT